MEGPGQSGGYQGTIAIQLMAVAQFLVITTGEGEFSRGPSALGGPLMTVLGWALAGLAISGHSPWSSDTRLGWTGLVPAH
jgi:hypothetical protein